MVSGVLAAYELANMFWKDDHQRSGLANLGKNDQREIPLTPPPLVKSQQF